MNKVRIGEKVVHCPEGVCVIEEICQLDDGKEKNNYYKLRSLVNGNKVIYILETMINQKVRPLISKEQAKRLLEIEPEDRLLSEYSNIQKIKNMQQQAMREDNLILIMKLVKLYMQRKEYWKISISDYCWVKIAEQYLFSELSEVLDCNYTTMHMIIQNRKNIYKISV